MHFFTVQDMQWHTTAKFAFQRAVTRYVQKLKSEKQNQGL